MHSRATLNISILAARLRDLEEARDNRDLAQDALRSARFRLADADPILDDTGPLEQAVANAEEVLLQAEADFSDEQADELAALERLRTEVGPRAWAFEGELVPPAKFREIIYRGERYRICR